MKRFSLERHAAKLPTTFLWYGPQAKHLRTPMRPLALPLAVGLAAASTLFLAACDPIRQTSTVLMSSSPCTPTDGRVDPMNNWKPARSRPSWPLHLIKACRIFRIREVFRYEEDSSTPRARTWGAASERERPRTPKPRRTCAYLMITIDIAAIFKVFVSLLNIDMAAPNPRELVATSGLSIIAACVLGLLTHPTGYLVSVWRVTEAPLPTPGSPGPVRPAPAKSDFPPKQATLIARMLALFVVSTLSGISILTRIVEEAITINNPVLGWILGILMCIAVVVAPWLVVLDEMRSGSAGVRTIEAITRLTKDAHDTEATHHLAAAQHDKRADTWYRNAERLVTPERRYDDDEPGLPKAPQITRVNV
jgi:hypothetical protein